MSITVPKLGNSRDENEDNIFEPSKSEIDSDAMVKFAIADGATESSFSKEWSELLVSSFKDNRFDKEYLAETLRIVSESWRTLVESKELPWYAKQKVEMGAYATFLGLTINRDKNSFDSLAIGDCNLFQVRNNEIVFSFPITAAEEFGNTPNLIGSNQFYQIEYEKIVLYSTNSIEPNDLIILATDALALWIFKQKDLGEKPWTHLQNIMENFKDDFENWLNNQRRENNIKNDDVTLVIIKFNI